ncbi:MAG: ferrous iron transport protein B [Ruminococcus sp.]|nr:ferrous iron transport protein B [Ruminococcus sp.]
MQKITIALAGNPNSGKTTVFNALTGGNQYVGNWAGVTVEKKSGTLKSDKDAVLVDLPGIYALSPYSPEEIVTRNCLLGVYENEKPNAIIDVVDASNIERNLYLTTQLAETGIPVVVLLNMMDISEKRGDKIDPVLLQKRLGLPVLEASALHEEGLSEAAAKAIKHADRFKVRGIVAYPDEVRTALSLIKRVIAKKTYSPEAENYIAVNLFERDSQTAENLKLTDHEIAKIDGIIKEAEVLLSDSAEEIISKARYDYIGKILDGCYIRGDKANVSDKIDAVLTNRFLALPIFALIMFLIYYISVSTVGAMGTDWVNDVLFGEIIPPAAESVMTNLGAADWVQSLVTDGIIGGVGAVLGFLPQMAVLFLLLSLLEDCGYMSRIAFILDRIFRKLGFSGKSFIPFLVSTGCGVPGIMAAKPIEDEKQRRLTIMTTTFMPCSAKLPIIALIAGSLFGDSGLVAFSAYIAGILSIVLSGLILKQFKALKTSDTPFIMELPAYHMPRAKNILRHTWNQLKAFVVKAGTIIFIACAIIWFLSNFGFENGTFGMVSAEESMLAEIGRAFAWIFTPLGFGHWQFAVATITGLAAKENVVGTLGVLFNTAEETLPHALSAILSPAAAYAFLLFNLLCAPCFAAVGAIRREMGSMKWTFIAVLYQTGFAYIVSFAVYMIWNAITIIA